MTINKKFDVIIIGGSYAGLSAAMALGRSLRNVLIIDSGVPCNRQTPHSHNFITQDGEKPHVISAKAKEQVLKYDTVQFINDIAVEGRKADSLFEITTQSNQTFTAKKIFFATGLKDIMPEIEGFAECWGTSVIHCPYCHGYEVKHEKTGILANGDAAFHYAQLINHWTKDLTIFTNGKSALTDEQTAKVKKHHIQIIEKEIAAFKQEKGYIKHIAFKDNSTFDLKAIYSRPSYEQHCKIPANIGCELNELGLIKVDMFYKTTVENIFACGDSTTLMRSVANAVAAGNMAAAVANSELIEQEFD